MAHKVRYHRRIHRIADPRSGSVLKGRTRRRRRSSSARRELIEIQKGIVERLQREIDESVGEPSPVLQLYNEEYWDELQGYERIATPLELIEDCAEGDIVYLGDYHTLRAAQLTACRLVEAIHQRRPDMTLAVEMVHSDRQDVLDAYLEGELDEASFLEAIDYRRTWDFHWAPYRELLDVCRTLSVRVMAINYEPDRKSPSRVLERDFHAADLIAQELTESPGRLVLVFDGDLHVASEHLPLIVASKLQGLGDVRAHTIVHQNAEPIYWQLAELGLERTVDVVKVKERVYCIFSATPLVKLQSYLNWQEDHAELATYVEPVWRGEADLEEERDYAEQVHEVVRTIAGFLGLEHPGLEDLTVYTTRDLDLLARLEEDPEVTPEILEGLKGHIERSESYFVAGANIIYLADTALYAAAEEATHFINTVVGGHDPSPRDARDAFYVQAIRETLGFFGSRLIDHKRYCLTEADMRAYLERTYRRRLGARGRELKETIRFALRHLEAERADCRPRPPGFRRRGPTRTPLFRLPAARRDAVAHLLGYVLGDKLHAALLRGEVAKTEIRRLFTDPLAPGQAERLYLQLAAHLGDVKVDTPYF